MRVVIAGAGDVGFHLARLLASENQDTILIDNNQEVLDYASSHLDISSILGDASSPSVLEKSEIDEAELFIAVTTSQTTNLVACIMAKKMGAKQTIARITNNEYLEADNKKMFREMGIDKLISPNRLATLEIQRLLEQCEVTDIFEFEEGKLSLAGISLRGKPRFGLD
jgi:trk system potassium uptake protein TrkA